MAFVAVGETATRALAASLAEGGTAVVYGLLSGEENSIVARNLVFAKLLSGGIRLADWFQTASKGKLKDLNTFLAKTLPLRSPQTEVDKRYRLSKVSEALAFAGQANCFGKIILTSRALCMQFF